MNIVLSCIAVVCAFFGYVSWEAHQMLASFLMMCACVCTICAIISSIEDSPYDDEDF